MDEVEKLKAENDALRKRMEKLEEQVNPKPTPRMTAQSTGLHGGHVDASERSCRNGRCFIVIHGGFEGRRKKAEPNSSLTISHHIHPFGAISTSTWHRMAGRNSSFISSRRCLGRPLDRPPRR